MHPYRHVQIISLFTLLGLLIPAIHSPIQAQIHQFDRISVVDGLPHHEVYATARDSIGYLWIATRAGLRRWDGRRPEYPESLDPSILSSDWIHALHVINDSTLVAGTAGSGLYRVGYRAGTVHAVQSTRPCSTGNSAGPSDLFIVGFSDLHDGIVGVHTNRRGLWLLYPSGQFCPAEVLGDPEVVDQIVSITAVHRSADGVLWVGTWSKGLFSLHPESGSDAYRVRKHELSGLPNGRVRALWSYEEDTLLVGTSGAGLMAFDTATQIGIQIQDLFGHQTADLHPKAWTITESPDETLWIGTFGGGLFKTEPETDTFQHFTYDESDDRTISGNEINHLYIDAYGLLWISAETGLSATPVVPPFRHRWTLDESITALGPASSDRILLGTESTVYRIDRMTGQSGRVADIASITGRDSGNDVTVIREHPQGLLVGTGDNGLVRISDDGKSKSVPLVGPTFVDSRAVKDVAVASDGFTIVTGFRLGIVHLTPELEVRKHHGRADSVVYNIIGTPNRVAMRDSARILIGGFQSGMHQLDVSTGHHSRLASWSGQSHDPGLDRITGIELAGEELAWASTDAGLIRLNPETGTGSLWPADNEWRERALIGLTGDESGRIWTLTDRTITRFDPSSGEPAILRIQSPLDEAFTYVDRGIAELDERTMIVAGQNSVYEIDAAFEPPRRPEPIISLNVDGRPVSPGSGERGLTVLPRDVSGLGFDVTVPDLHNPEAVQIRFALFGVDSTYRTVRGTHAGNTYVDLPARNVPYELHIRTIDSWGYSTGTSLRFRVLPPVWKTSWFLSVVVIFLVGIVSVLVIASWKRRRSEAVEIQAALVASREEERAMLSRMLHDETIQNLLSARRLITNNDGTARSVDEGTYEQLAELLAESTDQIRRICGELRPEALDAFGLPTALASMIRRYRASRPDVVVESSISSDIILTGSQARTLYRIFQVALANIERHARADRVSIELFEVDEGIRFLIVDNGIGFDPPESKLALARNRQFGLLGMQEWADSIEAHLVIKSEPGRGTRISVTVPVDGTRGRANMRSFLSDAFHRIRRLIHE